MVTTSPSSGARRSRSISVVHDVPPTCFAYALTANQVAPIRSSYRHSCPVLVDECPRTFVNQTGCYLANLSAPMPYFASRQYRASSRRSILDEQSQRRVEVCGRVVSASFALGLLITPPILWRHRSRIRHWPAVTSIAFISAAASCWRSSDIGSRSNF